MIIDNCDKTYTVIFPGDLLNPVLVNTPTEAEQGLYFGGSEYGFWPLILEKANGIYRQLNKGHLGNTPAECADHGGDPSDVLKLLTAKKSDDRYVDYVPNFFIRNRLNKAIKERAYCNCCQPQRSSAQMRY